MSDAEDYLRFCEMLLNGGQGNGHRLLSPRTVDVMSSVFVPDTFPGRTKGRGFGLAVQVLTDAIAANARISNGSYGWEGALGTHFWMDPKRNSSASSWSGRHTYTPTQRRLRGCRHAIDCRIGCSETVKRAISVQHLDQRFYREGCGPRFSLLARSGGKMQHLVQFQFRQGNLIMFTGLFGQPVDAAV